MPKSNQLSQSQGQVPILSNLRHSVNELNENGKVIENVQKTVTIEPIGPRRNSAGYLNPTPDLTTYGGAKLGWIQGVVVPCLLNIWGVMLFLRLSWVVGQAGIILTFVIILLSAIVFVITAFSLSAICTNGELHGGGVYYLVSKSLGAELGASAGIIFALANSAAASMNIIGFCDSLNELLKSKGLMIIDNSQMDVRIVGTFALVAMCLICAFGMDWETKTQKVLIIMIVAAIVNFIIGAAIGPRSDTARAQGFVGISIENANKNLLPDFRFSEGMSHNFISVFAIYFPAVTGVQTGANIYGDLRDPAEAIPKGTFLAFGISTGSYVVMAILSGMGTLRDASGDVSDLTVSVLESCKPDCEFGLHNDYEVMQLMALWGPFIYGGCWAATLSTALTNLLTVPRLIQALGVDRIYPGFLFFSKPFGENEEPYRGYVLTFIVSLLFLLIADLNTIAPMISNFYLASYALINFCTFHAAVVQQINWRPNFYYFNKWLSLIGFVMCTVMMIIISWMLTLTTIFIFMTFYLLVIYTKPETSWGSSSEAQQYQTTLASILNISRRPETVKSYNPQLLVLAGKPYERPGLIDMAHVITRMGSFMIVADIEKRKLSHSERLQRISQAEDWLLSGHNRSFYVLLTGFELDEGVTALAQVAGLGRFVPNVVLMGYKHYWTTTDPELLNHYVRAIQNSITEQLAVAIFRLPIGSLVKSPSKQNLSTLQRSHSKKALALNPQRFSLMHSNSDLDGMFMNAHEPKTTHHNQNNRNSSEKSQSSTNPKGIVMGTGKTLDAWWMYDDGGLNILLPYIIARRAYTGKKIPLRIFTNTKTGHEQDSLNQMKHLLARYRIEYSDLIMIDRHDLSDTPSDATWRMFNKLIENFKIGKYSTDWEITDKELELHQERISRHLRIRELLLKHSSAAGLIVMTLPLPRLGTSYAMYMSWLEMLSSGLPPMLLVRGNTATVLSA